MTLSTPMTWFILILVSVGDCTLLYIALRVAWVIMEGRPEGRRWGRVRYTGPPVPSLLTLLRRRLRRWIRRGRRELAKR